MQIITHPEIISYEFRPKSVETMPVFSNFNDLKYFVEISEGEEFLKLVHSENFIQKIKKAAKLKSEIAELRLKQESYKVACLSIGVAVSAAKHNDFAIGVLTGHHAGKELARGFCLFNSIAITAQKFVNEGKKVCIIDIDGHHGDGTQSIFYKTDQVLSCSIHQKDAYPGTGKSNEIGSGKGKGYNINIPIPKGSGDDVFLGALDEILVFAIDYNPDYIGVFAGFDGYYKDALLNLNYSLDGFNEAGRRIKQSFKYKNVFAILGGGYHLDVEDCISSFVSGINQVIK